MQTDSNDLKLQYVTKDDFMKSLFIAESETHVCAALCLMIENQPGINLVGEADHSESLLVQLVSLHPDALLLDWNLEGIHQPRLIRALQEHCPQTQIIVMSVKPEDELIYQEWNLGGFLSKQLSPEEFIANLSSLLTSK